MAKKSPITIHTYRGFISPKRIFLHGRVLEDEKIKVNPYDQRFKTLWNNFKRFESDEIEGVVLKITVGTKSYKLKTDDEGYYTLDKPFDRSSIKPRKNWTNAEIVIQSIPKRKAPTTKFKAPIFVPSAKAQFGIISDIDDTVLQTFVSGRFKLRMMYHSFMKNPYQRKAMEGIVPFYQQLEKGIDGQQQNPFFYLSDSPWNIYDALTTFMEVQHLPKGPLFLRDYGWPTHSDDNYRGHKLSYLERVIKAYPKLPFILLGDTASHDADYYLEIAKQFPKRIKRIYIRKTRDNWNARRITKLVKKSNVEEIKLILSTEEMIEDALRIGLIA